MIENPITYFTSDLHHKHKRIVELTERRTACTQEQHDDWLIDTINSRVRNQDKLYLLGDISFSHKFEEVSCFYRKLNGQKFVIKGNHDDRKILDSLKTSGIIQGWHDYKEITEEINGVKQYICMMHFPLASWHKQHYGSWMLHGHSHSSYQGQGKILDVGIDMSYKQTGRYSVFSISEISNFMQDRSVYISDHHKEPQ
jgi:calcineurin-like phosphoesterase family protein